MSLWTMLMLSVAAAGGMQPGALRCEYKVNPLGIDAMQPRLAWKSTSSRRGEMQTAYQIIVGENEKAIQGGAGDLWDSGKVASEQSAQITYGGKPLRSREHVWWRVRVWDRDGKVSAWTYDAWTPTHGARPTRDPATLVAGALVAGAAPASEFFSGGGERNARTTYALPNERVTSHPVPSFPVRTSSLRGLGSPQNSFANETFMDELAAAAGIDPIELRRRHLSDPRALAAIETVAKRAGWASRASAPERGGAASNGTRKGRGFAYVQYDRTEAYVAAVVDVDVRPDTGSVRVRRVCVAHDCGLIVNPDGLRNQIEGNVVQAISRTLKEAVRFDSTRVTGVDWNGYPILRFSEIPDAIDVDLIDRPDQPSVGAGEAATSPIPAAIANAIFDATGARVRQVPFTPDRVREALRGSKV